MLQLNSEMLQLNSWLGAPLEFLNAPFEFLNASFEFLTGSTIWSPNCCNWNPKCIFRMNFTMVWWENATAQRFLTRAIDFERQYNDFQRSPKKKTQYYSDYHRIWTMLNYSTTIYIDVHFKSTTANKLHRFFIQKDDSPSIFIECERFWMIVQWCSSIWNNFDRPYKHVHRVSNKQHDSLPYCFDVY